jgi:fructose-1,6-bisphosphatase/inositol monophosphatase family enzyme
VNGPCYGEEHEHSAGRSAWMWVIDPIDGTASFALGYLHWATLIGLNDGTRPVLGVAYQPFVGEFFLGL